MKSSLKMGKYLLFSQWLIFITAIISAVVCIPLFIFTVSVVYVMYATMSIGIAIFVCPKKKGED